MKTICNLFKLLLYYTSNDFVIKEMTHLEQCVNKHSINLDPISDAIRDAFTNFQRYTIAMALLNMFVHAILLSIIVLLSIWIVFK